MVPSLPNAKEEGGKDSDTFKTKMVFQHGPKQALEEMKVSQRRALLLDEDEVLVSRIKRLREEIKGLESERMSLGVHEQRLEAGSGGLVAEHHSGLHQEQNLEDSSLPAISNGLEDQGSGLTDAV